MNGGDIMKPIIGVPLRYNVLSDGRPIVYMSEKIRRTIQNAGGEVFAITPVHDVDYFYTKGSEFPELTCEDMRLIDKVLDGCDGVLFPGGIKFTPYDRYLLERIIEKNIPVLGICLGMQLMSCYKEDICLVANDGDINHQQESDEGYSHRVKIFKDSRLYKILNKEEIFVNSFHKYHITENNLYRPTALSEDGLIEGIEYPSSTFNIGVQWHPEISYLFDDNSRKIIDAFIEAAMERCCSRSDMVKI